MPDFHDKPTVYPLKYPDPCGLHDPGVAIVLLLNFYSCYYYKFGKKNASIKGTVFTFVATVTLSYRNVRGCTPGLCAGTSKSYGDERGGAEKTENG